MDTNLPFCCYFLAIDKFGRGRRRPHVHAARGGVSPKANPTKTTTEGLNTAKGCTREPRGGDEPIGLCGVEVLKHAPVGVQPEPHEGSP